MMIRFNQSPRDEEPIESLNHIQDTLTAVNEALAQSRDQMNELILEHQYGRLTGETYVVQKDAIAYRMLSLEESRQHVLGLADRKTRHLGRRALD